MSNFTPRDQAQSPSNNSYNKNKKADAFLNLELVLPNGDRIKIPKGVALDISNKIGRTMINKANANADFEFNLVGTVHVVADESDESEYEL